MSGRRWNALFWVAMLAVLGGSAASLVVWPVHRSPTAAKRPATEPATTRASPRPRAAPRPPQQLRPPPASGRVKLYVFAARGPSRVLVRRSTSGGAVLFDATLARGGTLKISGPRLYTQVSAIANVNVRVGTHMVDLTCTAAGGVILTQTRAIPTQPPNCPKPLTGS